MGEVKINNKKYKVPELKFEHYTKIEEQGFSIIDAFKKEQIFLIAMGFVCAVTGCDREESEKLIQQHILGGGNIMDIVRAFSNAVSESDFFTEALGLKKEKKQTEEKTETEEK